ALTATRLRGHSPCSGRRTFLVWHDEWSGNHQSTHLPEELLFRRKGERLIRHAFDNPVQVHDPALELKGPSTRGEHLQKPLPVLDGEAEHANDLLAQALYLPGHVDVLTVVPNELGHLLDEIVHVRDWEIVCRHVLDHPERVDGDAQHGNLRSATSELLDQFAGTIDGEFELGKGF